MDVMAKTKFARISPLKARDLARGIQGMKAEQALRITEFGTRKAAKLIGKTLKSAIANAEHNANLSLEDLTVKTAVIEEGPCLKRFWPRARGGASPVRKRMSHVKVVLTDGK